jgi:N-methylhydantoinase B
MTGLDPITTSIVQNRFQSIVAEMGESILNTAYSQILNSSRDFSTAICDNSAQLIAQADHLPVHIGALSTALEAIIEFFGDDINPGDVFFSNDPYNGGSHLPDLTTFTPVFGDDKPLFWTVIRAHQADVGGSTYGGYNAAATEIWQEGVRYPPMRLWSRGELNRDVQQMLVANVRHPRDFRGDLSAMIGAGLIGQRRIANLARELSWDTLVSASEEMLKAAERQARHTISEWRDGVYKGEAILDDDGHGAVDIAIRATVTKRGDHLTVDLSESDPQVRGFVNSSYANTKSAVAVAISYLLDPDTPKNHGAFSVADMIAKQGTVVWPHEGAAVTLCTSHCSQEIIEAVIKALVPACPERCMAGWGRRFRIALHGQDPRTEKPFIWHLFHARPGGGASSAGDGFSSIGEWGAAGGMKFGSIEVTEVRFPLLFRRHEFREDSGGDGKYRGGNGCSLELEVRVAAPVVCNTAGDGVRHGACGILGGQDGAPHRYRVISREGSERELKTKEVGVSIHPGDVLVVQSGGGGGWGSPDDRNEEARLQDRRRGFVS